MAKREDWVDKMWLAIKDSEDEHFEWGKHDCCLFSAKVVDAMSDSNFLQKLLNSYSDDKSALEFIKSFGSLREATASFLGAEAPLSFMQRGDVVLFDNDGRETLGICIGSTIASVGETGAVVVAKSHAICRWSII